jgi:hypothetical protein
MILPLLALSVIVRLSVIDTCAVFDTPKHTLLRNCIK